MEWLVALTFVVLLWLRQSTLVVLGVGLLLLYVLSADAHAEYLVYDLWDGLNRATLLAVPTYVLAHALMCAGQSVQRLSEFLRVLTSPLPVGMAVGSLLSIVVVSALCGSPAIALLAIGPATHRALLAEGYGASFSMGLLCAGTVLGSLLPLSVPLIVYSVVSQTEIFGLFSLAGIAAASLVLALVVYSACTNWNRAGFFRRSGDLRTAFVEALPALVPILVLVAALISTRLSAAQCGMLFLVAAVAAELGVYRGLSKQKLRDAGLDVISQLGRILPLVLFSVSLGAYLTHHQFSQQLGGWLEQQDFGSGQFLGWVNFALLFLGLLLDAVSALLVVTPILEPAAEELGLMPEPFGVMLVLNLSLSYLTPPNGLVLIAAMLAFRESFNAVFAAVVPFLAVLWAGVLVLALLAL